MGTILLIILILLLIGALPAWPYSSGWGYWPSGGVGLILLIVIVLALTGKLLSRCAFERTFNWNGGAFTTSAHSTRGGTDDLDCRRSPRRKAFHCAHG